MFSDHNFLKLLPLLISLVICFLFLHLFSSPGIGMAEKKSNEPVPALIPQNEDTYQDTNKPIPGPLPEDKDTFLNTDHSLPVPLPDIEDTYPGQNQAPEKPKLPNEIPRPLGYYEYQFDKTFGGYGLGNGYFRLPIDIGIDRDDNIYICDMEADKIQTFDSEGNFDEEWESLLLGNDEAFKQSSSMDEPKALYVDYKERIGQTVIYVADTKNNRILQFNKDGRLIDPEGEEIKDNQRWFDMVNKDLLWGEFGSGKGEFHHPVDIAVDESDNCYVLDSKNSRIQCFDYKGEFKFEWGGFGSGPGSFIRPTRMAYDPSRFRAIWVIDSKNSKFIKFDLNGDFVKAYIPKDKNGQPLPGPSDLCFDTQGFIYVTDSTLNKVFKYNNDVEYIQCWGETGSGQGQFKNPQAIAVDSEDRVLVVDSGNFRIQIFRRF
ncbi:MAG: NHL repeat-containing protein [bacterium]